MGWAGGHGNDEQRNGRVQAAARERDRGWEKHGESEREVGGAWRHPKRPGRSGKQEVAGRAPACVGHALVLLARRKTTGEGARWLGRPRGPPGKPR